MTGSLTGRIVRLLFGVEGRVVADRELQAAMTLAAIAGAGIFVVSPIVSVLAGPFAVSQAAVGQIMTVYTLPSILVIPLFGVLADRIGRKPVIVLGLVLFGCAGTSIAFASRFETVLVLRFVQGMGHAAVMPLTVTVIGDLYSGQREVTAQGMRGGSVQVVGIVAPPLAGALVVGSWVYPFLLFSLALPAAAWVWIAFPSLEPAETTTFGQYIHNLVASLTHPRLALVLLSFFLRFSLTFAFLAYISVLIGQTAFVGGIAVSVFGLVSLVATTQTGRVVDWLSPLPAMVVGFLVAGAGMVAIGTVTTLPSIVVSVVLFAVGAGVTAPVQNSLVSQYADRELRAGSVSTAYVFIGTGQTVGPLLMGVALGYVPVQTGFVVFGAVGATLGVAVMGLAYRLERRE